METQVESTEAVETVSEEVMNEEAVTAPDKEAVEVEEESQADKELKAARAQAAAERRKAREYKQKLAEYESQQKEEVEVELPPNESDFEDREKYLVEMAKYEARNEIRAEQQRKVEAEKQAKEQEAAKTYKERVDSVMDNGSAEYNDFEDLVYAMPLSEHALQAAIESENSHKILYHLAKNQEEAQRIFNLSPYAQALEVGRIDSRVTNSVKKTTKAPDPITPVGGPSKPSKKTSEMSPSEYREWRNRRKGRK